MPALSASGYLRSGLPYNRLGHGPSPLVVFSGLMFENKPQSPLMVREYSFLGQDYTVLLVLRKPGLPQGYTLQQMAADYATMIEDEFGGAVDVLGVSTGGSIAQHFAADFPHLVRRLVLHSSAYTLAPVAKQAQMRLAQLAQQGRWRQASAEMMRFLVPPGPLAGPLVWLMSSLMALNPPRDASDLVVTALAEDQFNFKERLAQITASTLVVAGARDPFYTEALFRQTAAGIPNARLILYSGMGHPASGKGFQRDVLSFLRAAS